MSLTLVFKLLRDLRVGLLAVCLLLGAFEFLWGKATEQTVSFMRELEKKMPLASFANLLFKEESGKMMQKLIGGDNITFGQGLDSLTIGYVHPLVLTILCVWGIGRAAGAIAGELDKGTMELLLAQPIERWRVITSHFVIDLLTIPLVCLCMYCGTVSGAFTYDLPNLTQRDPRPIDPWFFIWAAPSVGSLVFAVTGVTMLLSAAGRSRTKVLGLATMLTLLQFLINLLGQVWPAVEPFRPFTVFYYYQPQPMLLGVPNAGELLARNVGTLLAVGLVGYGSALIVFCRRDLPAPL